MTEKGVETAKRLVLGQWTDGVVTLSLEPDHKLRWIFTDPENPLGLGKRTHGSAVDWWNFAMWGIALLNQEHKHGTVVGVLRVQRMSCISMSGSSVHRIELPAFSSELASRRVSLSKSLK